ncbi:ROK family protein [Planctomycetales bacterium ZRK34]|nr:ROK family protein [Planctomycetales bacterium ZRK34]
MSVLACDVGGTRIKVGLVSDGQLLATQTLDAAIQEGLGRSLVRIGEALQVVCEQAGIEPSACRGIGMGLAALVDWRQCRVIDPHSKYTDAEAVDLNVWARETFGLPLAADNDARAALLGEWTYGAGRGSDNLGVITLGTGIGTAVGIDGHVLRGPNFRTGNFCGHMIVAADGRTCGVCGMRGCVEAETGSAQLPDVAQRMYGFAQSALSQCDRIDYAAVCRCAAEVDPVAAALLGRATYLWSVLCVNMIHAFDLDRIVFGGGVMGSAEMILPPIQEFVDRHVCAPAGASRVQIISAEQPDHMALLGCEALVDEKLSFSHAV